MREVLHNLNRTIQQVVQFLLCSLITSSSVYADDGLNPPQYPWLTGTLLSPFGYVIDKGHLNYEPYLYGNTTYGLFDQHWRGHSQTHTNNVSTQLFFWYGFAQSWDIDIAPLFSWNHTSGASHWVVNDVPIELEYQILYERINRWRPAIKLTLLATVPLGKYQKLNPRDKGTDIGGLGNWQPGVQLAFQRLISFTGVHYLVIHYAIEYSIPNPVHVKGYNVYGGGRDTHGKVFPGASLLTILGLEYSLTEHWALALDIQYLHKNRTRFSGHKGFTHQIQNQVGTPSSEQFSLAPAIEYNWSSTLGLIAGVWFSLAGRNTSEFVNAIIAINVYQ